MARKSQKIRKRRTVRRRSRKTRRMVRSKPYRSRRTRRQRRTRRTRRQRRPHRGGGDRYTGMLSGLPKYQPKHNADTIPKFSVNSTICVPHPIHKHDEVRYHATISIPDWTFILEYTWQNLVKLSEDLQSSYDRYPQNAYNPAGDNLGPKNIRKKSHIACDGNRWRRKSAEDRLEGRQVEFQETVNKFIKEVCKLGDGGIATFMEYRSQPDILRKFLHMKSGEDLLEAIQKIKGMESFEFPPQELVPTP